jgi:hypothetical protein
VHESTFDQQLNAGAPQLLRCYVLYSMFALVLEKMRMKFEVQHSTINSSVLVSIASVFELSPTIFQCHGATDWPFVTDPKEGKTLLSHI